MSTDSTLEKNMSNPDAPFFVLGAARSGTTMFRLMLNRHPRLAIPFESHFMMGMLRELPFDRPLLGSETERFIQLVITEKNFASWHLSPRQVRDKIESMSPGMMSDLIDALFRMEIADTGKPRWGDKTPMYYTCWRPLMNLFPNSRVIHIIRDGRDVCQSLEKLDWHGPTNQDRAKYWRDRVEIAYQAQAEFGTDRQYIVRYEDLVTDTRATLINVCEFLEESYEPSMMSFFEDASDHMSDIDGDIHRKVHRQPSEQDIYRWRHNMSTSSQQQFEMIAGCALRQMNYECLFSSAAS
ncbi:MAG: hypothetical protein GKR95_25315 [Gammaproteobacteria bacterium]|nr:hypothetical protein [Gammaproteobacteria bacterium]